MSMQICNFSQISILTGQHSVVCKNQSWWIWSLDIGLEKVEGESFIPITDDRVRNVLEKKGYKDRCLCAI